jgi:hypothetical protein
MAQRWMSIKWERHWFVLPEAVMAIGMGALMASFFWFIHSPLRSSVVDEGGFAVLMAMGFSFLYQKRLRERFGASLADPPKGFRAFGWCLLAAESLIWLWRCTRN